MLSRELRQTALADPLHTLGLAPSPVTYRGHTVDALPNDRTVAVLEKYHSLHWDQTLPTGNASH
jgi:hypothetical protein